MEVTRGREDAAFGNKEFYGKVSFSPVVKSSRCAGERPLLAHERPIVICNELQSIGFHWDIRYSSYRKMVCSFCDQQFRQAVIFQSIDSSTGFNLAPVMVAKKLSRLG